MTLEDSLEISISAINTHRKNVELISSNIANAATTRGIDGGPYKRKIGIYAETELSFDQELSRAEKRVFGGGVKIAEVVEDPTPFQRVYKPSHPDADKDGYVELPNVNMSQEMIDLTYTSKLYDMNITAFNVTKGMVQSTLSIPIDR